MFAAFQGLSSSFSISGLISFSLKLLGKIPLLSLLAQSKMMAVESLLPENRAELFSLRKCHSSGQLPSTPFSVVLVGIRCVFGYRQAFVLVAYC